MEFWRLPREAWPQIVLATHGWACERLSPADAPLVSLKEAVIRKLPAVSAADDLTHLPCSAFDCQGGRISVSTCIACHTAMSSPLKALRIVTLALVALRP